MVQDIIPGTEEKLIEDSAIGYIGFDPTSDSLHIGSLVQILILKHFQMCGHKPIFLIGGATGMIGDPSGKSSERNLLSEAELKHNIKAIKKQLSKFLDFDSKDANAAIIFDNSNWFDKINLIDFFKAYPNKNIAIDLNALSKTLKKVDSLKELIEFYSESPFKKLKDGRSST